MKPDLYTYADYRRYLADYCSFRKRERQGFTIRGFLAVAGFSGPNFLKEIIDGRKNLSVEGAGRFAAALELDKRESSYFLLLVQFDRESDPDQKKLLLESLGTYAGTSGVQALYKDQYAYLSRWYIVAIREYLHAHTFTGDCAALAAALDPPISDAQAKQALRLIEKLGLAAPDERGVWQLADPILSTGPRIGGIAAREYHRSMLELAARSIDAVATDRRQLKSICGSFSNEAREKIIVEMDAFRAKVLDIIAHDTSAEKSVHQIGLQLFPLERATPKRRRRSHA